MKNSILILVVLGFSLACDYIEDPIQGGSITVPDDQVVRKALIEDFTGHRCNNCPKASEEIKEIEQNSPGVSVAVAIHAGAANFIAPDPPDYPTDFRTPEGDEMKDFFNVTYNPAGMVNRLDYNSQGSHLKLYQSWPTEVANITSLPPPIDLLLSATYDSTSRQLQGEIASRFLLPLNDPLSISIWLCESKIVAPQKMPDNSRNPNYEHNNVFRESLNSTFGENLSSNGGVTGDTIITSFNYFVPNSYNSKNCKLVTFVFNRDTQEVLQAEEVALSEL